MAAPFTPFEADGAVNFQVIEEQAASLVTSGVRGAFVCGTTGEGMSLTVAERMAVAERWREVADKSLRLIIHVGHTSIGDSRALAAHAQQLGASGIGCFAPFFFKPALAEELVAFCADVAAAAPDLPFYYYHIPSMTGVSIAAAEFLRTAAPRIPNLAGIKFTFENLMDYADCLRFDNRAFDILFGRDELLLASLALGGQGAIGLSYNFAAPLFQRIIDAFQRGDLAEAQNAQACANAMIQTFLRFGAIPAAKAMMKMIGIDCGPPRLPLRSLGASEQRELRSELDRIGFFDFASRI